MRTVISVLPAHRVRNVDCYLCVNFALSTECGH